MLSHRLVWRRRNKIATSQKSSTDLKVIQILQIGFHSAVIAWTMMAKFEWLATRRLCYYLAKVMNSQLEESTEREEPYITINDWKLLIHQKCMAWQWQNFKLLDSGKMAYWENHDSYRSSSYSWRNLSKMYPGSKFQGFFC